MNKIILDNNKNIELNIYEDSICNISKEYEINTLSITLENNIKFIINHYSEIDNNELKINIIEKDNAEFIYNHSFINKGEYNLNCNIEMLGNNSKNIINIHGITDKGNTNITIDGKVNENTFDNELDEKIKMININNGESIIEPNMYINTNNVIANHSASISDIDENYLFYLNSKGINIEKSKELIIDGFLKNDARI